MSLSELLKDLHRDKIQQDTIKTIGWTGLATCIPFLSVLIIYLIRLSQEKENFDLIIKSTEYIIGITIYFILGVVVFYMILKEAKWPSWFLYAFGFVSIMDLFVLVHSTGGLKTSIFAMFYNDFIAVSIIVSERAKRTKEGGRVALVIIFAAICIFFSFIFHTILDPSNQSINVPVICHAAYSLYAILIIGLSGVINISKLGTRIISTMLGIAIIVLIFSTIKL